MLIVVCFRGFDETKVWGQCIYKKLPAAISFRLKKKKKIILEVFPQLEENTGRGCG